MKHGPSSDDQTRKFHLLRSLYSYHEMLMNIQQAAQAAQKRISKDQDITPSQCKRITAPLLPRKHPAMYLKNLLSYPLHIPSIDRQRQQLLIELDQVEACVKLLRQQEKHFSHTSVNSSLENLRKIRESILETIQVMERKLSALNDLLKTILEVSISQEQSISLDASGQSSVPMEQVRLPSRPLISSSQQSSLNEVEPPVSGSSYQTYALGSAIIRAMVVIKWGLSAVWQHLSSRDQHGYREPVKTLPINTVVSAETPEQQLQRLYEVASFIDLVDMQEICLNLNVNYDRLTDSSPRERILSLMRLMYNRKRLDDLEQELRRILPERFPSNMQKHQE